MKLMCSDFWWFLMNVISKYLFLEQFCQFSEGVLKFLSEAGDSIHSFSSCIHIGALKTEWKCRISLKSAYLYTSIEHRLLVTSTIQLQCENLMAALTSDITISISVAGSKTVSALVPPGLSPASPTPTTAGQSKIHFSPAAEFQKLYFNTFPLGYI